MGRADRSASVRGDGAQLAPQGAQLMLDGNLHMQEHMQCISCKCYKVPVATRGVVWTILGV